jgi:hypothetical protein
MAHVSYPVLYKIKWDVSHWNYMVNIGGFTFENEVILFDGHLLYVEEVSEE